MSEKKTESGYTCDCGKFHKFGGWVFAHWNIELTHTCDACGATTVICEGEVLETAEAEPRKETP